MDRLILLGARSLTELAGGGSLNAIKLRLNERDIDFHRLREFGVSTGRH